MKGQVYMELSKKIAKKRTSISQVLKDYREKWSKTLILSLISFLVSRICILGDLSPLSLPFLMVHKGNIFVFLASVLGIVSNTALNPYKYGLMIFSAVIISTLIKIAFEEVNTKKTDPLVIFITKILFNMIFVLFREFTPYDIILGVFDAFVSALFYYILYSGSAVFDKFKSKRFYKDEEIVCALIIFSMSLAGIGDITFIYGLHMNNLIGVYLVLLIACNSNLGLASQAAALIGLSIGLTSSNIGICVATYALCGLMASSFKKFGKLAAVLGFVLGTVIIGIFLMEDYYMMVSFTEIAVSGILIILTPDAGISKLFYKLLNTASEYDKANTIREIATSKLEALGNAFCRLSETINISLEKTSLKTNEITSVFDETADKFCKNCYMKNACWGSLYDSTMTVFIGIAKTIDAKGDIQASELPKEFSEKCEKAPEIIMSIKRLYEIYRLNEAWQYKTYERANIFKEHFYDLSTIIEKLKNEIYENPYFDNGMSREIASELEKTGLAVKDINVIKDCNDDTELEICLFPCGKKEKCYRNIENMLYEIADAPFEKIGGHCGVKECRLHFKECEAYTLSNSVKQLPKNAGDRCGDSYTIKAVNSGMHFIALCDGSGSGENAGIYSGATVKLLENFLRTGFSKRSVLNLINASMLLGPNQDYFSTVDLFTVNLKNLNAEFIKSGASATYIIRENGEYDIIKGNNLPIGITKNRKEKVRKIKLRNSDIIIMATDGICDAVDKEDWIIDAVFASKLTEPEDISELILKIAKSASSADDMTVIVSKINQIYA